MEETKKNEIRAFFRQVTGLKDPYGDYQIIPALYVEAGRSVILRMLTGSGKSESILCAYLWALKQCADFPQQFVYGLPMRNLVESLGGRFAGYQKNFRQMSVAIQHGTQPGTPSFYSDIAVATIDQIISAYACTPLGYPVRHGSIPAGAIASAFLAFDEVHTFDPERALQSTLFIAGQSYKMGLPCAFLSATMPDSFIEVLEKRLKAHVIEVEEHEVPVRRTRQVQLVNCLTRRLTPEEVKLAWQRCEGSLLVVCNTVKGAQDLWQAVKHEMPHLDVLLLHSRFTAEDRAPKEQRLNVFLGKKASRRGIIITTQVVEVGLDVSTDLLLTELAPIDALIQRAGRVARWGGVGEIWLFGLEQAAPYSKKLVEATLAVLPKEPMVLDWEREKWLVNTVLNDPFAAYLSPKNRGKALHWLGEGAFSGKRSAVAKAIRDNQSCMVSIHDHAKGLGRDLWRLPRIRLNVWLLKAFAMQQGASGIGRVVVDETAHTAIDQQALVGCLPLSTPDWLFPGEFYVLSPKIARYEPQGRGLVLGEAGESLSLQAALMRKKLDYGAGMRETWQEHCGSVLEIFYEEFMESYWGVLKRLARWWKLPLEVFVARVALAVSLHDLGKLNVAWQHKIGRQAGELPIAKSGNQAARGKLPAHATVSAYLVQELFIKQWSRRFSEPLICAIAHHHSVRAAQVPSFELVPEWAEEVERLLSAYPELMALWDATLVANLSRQPAPTILSPGFPDIMKNGRAWRTYTIVSRLLRLSDRMASGGSEYALLRDEEWLTDV